MPWSADENRDWILERIYPTDTVLDIGAGAGIWSDLLKARVKHIDAVEIFEPYIERFGLEEKYREIYLGDFKTLDIPLNTYQVVILGDVLEHFEMTDALKVWAKAREIAGPTGSVLLSTPIVDWPQGEEEGNIHEAHLSFFDMEALKNLPGVIQSKEGDLIGSIIADGSISTLKPIAKDLTVLITTIPTRTERLLKAYRSAATQTLRPKHILVQEDVDKLGAPRNRDLGIARVETEWVALLDDDDYFYPDHLEALYTAAIESDADIVYSWFDVEGGTDPFPQNFGKPWDPENPIQVTVTVLAKVDVIRRAGGYSNTSSLSEEELASYAQGNTVGEDFRMIAAANAQGAKIVHLPKKTWAYVHWVENGKIGNTSGRPDRW